MIITVSGNVTSDPELRFTPSGQPVANFTVAVNKRRFNKDTNDWEDGETSFVSCAIWRQAAENVAESIVKGMRVLVTGEFAARNYETREGEKRTVWEMTVDDIGPSLKFATAKVTRTASGGGGGGGRGQQQRSQGQPQGDPWGGQGGGQQQRQQPPQQDPWAGVPNDEPPF